MKYLLLFTFAFSALTGFSQKMISCDFSTVYQRNLLHDKNFESDLIKTESKLKEYLTSGNSSRTAAVVYTLPVVFHVITNGGSVGAPDNPTDAAIMATLKLLNDTWSKIGASYGGADMQIKFALAQRSSTCSSTSGINRVNGSGVSDYPANGITTSIGGNEATVKGLSRWSSADYINIWIVTKINGSDTAPGGFAYFPEHADSRIDGITILAGTVDGINKTIAHEMGHVFGLYHTFRVTDLDETSCPPSTDCANTGDMICDTEPTKNVACGTAPNECSGAAYLIADAGLNYTVLNNYMGYGTCQFMFTEGQKTRARGFLELFRPGLIYSKALSPLAASPSVSPPLTATNGQSEFYGVERVKFGGIDLYSGTALQDNGNLINRTCNQRATVTSGSSTSLTVTSTYANPEYLRVYIDYNNDGDFLDENELVMSGDWVPSMTGNITIPLSAPTNVPLLMRVVADDVFGSPPTAIALNGDGQAEDFTVTIGGALPVTLLYFKGDLLANQQIGLNWETTSEGNSRAFILERGSNLIGMQQIANIDAAGNTTEKRAYQFIDSSPLKGINYYRLTEIDWDGSRFVFRAISVETKTNALLFPNPSVNNQFFLQIPVDTNVKVYNIIGQEIFCDTAIENADLLKVTARQQLAPGIYFVSLKGSDFTKSIRLVIP
ncbi:zinc-dependent metalloprotease [Dyadobacter sp. 3J3]|uniref:zinc-dependent metalloprotease n=1 Tax=Dyadobacter sp. 3J3 TaxID=2606600 RepID=UPI00135A88B8|nr:zinc-dependent metalloprotease [Dyadobacter sp. 3J3]